MIRLRECVHDYFFVKSLPLLKPGGILASITSRYTLDKRKNVVRRHLAMHMSYRSMRLKAESVPNFAERRMRGLVVGIGVRF